MATPPDALVRACATARVVVVTREGCHLCDDAVGVVTAVCAETGDTFAFLDVDADSELRAELTDHVPVTFVDSARVGIWTLSEPSLRAALMKADAR